MEIGTIATNGDVDYYSFTLTGTANAGYPSSGDLEVTVQPRNGSNFNARLELYNDSGYYPSDGGGLLVSSDNQTATNPDPSLSMYLLPGHYYLEVSAGGDGTTTGDYTLTVTFAPGANIDTGDIFPSPTVDTGPVVIATGDLSGNGFLDLVTANDGSYRPGGTFLNPLSNPTVSVLMGNGDGTFAGSPLRDPLCPQQPGIG